MDRERRRRAADVDAILRAGIAAADPGPAVASALARYPELDTARAVHIVAIGKAAVKMCAGALDSLHARVASCIVVAPRGERPDGALGARLLTAAHPIPDDASLRAGHAVAGVLRTAERDDAALVLLSGGASSLCVLPLAGVSLALYAHTVHALLQAGADIHELNTVRRQIDALKGGGMAALAAPARTIGLLVSDVPGDDLASIASGPLTPSPTGRGDALRVLAKYGIPADIVHADAERERGVPVDSFERVTTEIVLSNADARRGAAAEAERLGYASRVINEPITGEAREEARMLMERLARADAEADGPTCMIAGGETTVRVRGAGRGGRNQEFVLAAALRLAPDSRIVIGSAGTDGIDGATDAAGAVADGSVSDRGAQAGVAAADALRANDSGSFFARAGGAIRTGPTGTNVMDIVAAVFGPPRR